MDGIDRWDLFAYLLKNDPLLNLYSTHSACDVRVAEFVYVIFASFVMHFIVTSWQF